MKKIILAIAVVVGLSATSCKKEEAAKPQGPTTAAQTINVEYRISAQSGSVNATYMIPTVAGQLEAKTETINRNYTTINFDYTSGNFFSVQASNVDPAHKTVQVEIYVDGVLRASSISTSPSQNAIASGNY